MRRTKKNPLGAGFESRGGGVLRHQYGLHVILLPRITQFVVEDAARLAAFSLWAASLSETYTC